MTGYHSTLVLVIAVPLMLMAALVYGRGRSFPAQFQKIICVNYPAGLPAARLAVVANLLAIKGTSDYCELDYTVSPPGAKNARMTQLKLSLRFEGKGNGKISFWWNRPKRFRDDGHPYKFGLGVDEVIHDVDAYDPVLLSFNGPNRKEVTTKGNKWIEHHFDGEDLMGGPFQVMVLANFDSPGILHAQLSAITYDKDPKEEGMNFTDEEMDELELNVERRWSSLAYQRQILGGETLEEYLEH